MLPINNSDTAWLIVADYNQDNSIGYPDALREDILDPQPDQNPWTYEYRTGGNGVGSCFIGGAGDFSIDIFDYDNGEVGSQLNVQRNHPNVSEHPAGDLVGGMPCPGE